MRKTIEIVLLLFCCSTVNLKAQQLYESFDDFAPWLERTHSDTTYVFNFWATWCAPCVKELPYFEQLQKKLSHQKIKIVLVSLDFRKDLETKLKPFIHDQQFSMQVVALLDRKQQKWIEKIDPNWSGAIPATLAYRGNLRQFKEGEFEDEAELQQFVNRFFDPKNQMLRQNKR